MRDRTIRGTRSIDQINTSQYVSPLVRTTYLHRTPTLVVQVIEIIRLEKLVCELGKRDALLRLHPNLHTANG